MIEESNIGFNVKVAKSPVFNGEVGKVEEFVIVYRLYLKMKIRRVITEKQIQWILSYV